MAGLALEWWLRGLVFADAAAWRGWRVAVVWSALLGMGAASWRGRRRLLSTEEKRFLGRKPRSSKRMTEDGAAYRPRAGAGRLRKERPALESHVL